MLTHPLLLALSLCLLIAAMRYLTHRYSQWRLWQWLPTPVWCYGLPMVATSLGLTPAASPVYDAVSRWLLLPTLFLLLVPANLRDLARAGPRAIGCFAVGAAGIVAGLTTGFALWRHRLPPEAWQGIGALAGTWIGGSANMLAVAQSAGASESSLAPLIVVDTLLAYTWMGGLLWLARYQPVIDRAWQAEPITSAAEPSHPDRPLRHAWLATLVLAAGAAVAAHGLGGRLPELGAVVTAATWRILLITAMALALASWRAVARCTGAATTVSAPLLYLVLASMGARANVAALWQVPWWLAVGITAFATHGLLLAAAARWRRWPLALAATASQANVGGVASAPLVAAVYQPSLASLGVLLAILGNAVGTAAGLATAWLCRLLAGL